MTRQWINFIGYTVPLMINGHPREGWRINRFNLFMFNAYYHLLKKIFRAVYDSFYWLPNIFTNVCTSEETEGTILRQCDIRRRHFTHYRLLEIIQADRGRVVSTLVVMMNVVCHQKRHSFRSRRGNRSIPHDRFFLNGKFYTRNISKHVRWKIDTSCWILT